MSLVCLLTGTAVTLTLSYKTTGGLVCHCKSKCDPNFQCLPVSSGCTRGWSGPTCQRYNLALGKDTHQSSTLNDCRWADNATKRTACGWKNPSLAVDGSRSTDYWSGTCIHTDENQNQAWWSVNIGEIKQIYYIKIYSPKTNKQRMKGFKVTVDGQPCYSSTPNYTPVPPILIHCTTPMNGSNVLIKVHQEQFILNLCEVEVYECADGVFGEGCTSLCNCKDPGEVCDKVTGQCQSGCVDGYTGEGCQAICPHGKYGFNCSEVCGHCSEGNCSHLHGKCASNCKNGWTGDQCKECEDGKFGPQCSSSCKCKNVNETCNKTTGHCSSGCTDGYTGDGCQMHNLALGKDTHQSSTVDDCIWADNATKKACGWKNSSLAVDGNRSTDYWSGTCIHTNVNQNQAWWSVNLGQRHQIYYIKIYSPKTNPQRMEGFKVTVDNQPCYTSPPYDNLVPPISIHCTTPINGTNISIIAHQEQFILNLCEVEVYECADGVFGEGCSSPCNCKDPDEVCDKVTGQCQSGCVDGFTGEGCQTNCLIGHYGFNCSEVCGQCRGGDTYCNHVDGKCTHGCNSNWAGDQCKACSTYRFGPGCTKTCGKCSSRFNSNRRCNAATGYCKGSCQSNWTGPRCKQCEDRKFGVSCSYSCKCKNSNEVCNKTTGHCSSGCSDGYTGDSCQTRCLKGFYGFRCSEKCGHCAGGKINCNHVDGTCLNGCRGNWDGGQCKVCKDFWFGEGCSTECTCKDPDEVCNKTTGECAQRGCQDGRTGLDCQTPCADGTYGYKCSHQCGNCLNGEDCGKIEGECPSGCEDGFMLPVCQDCVDYRFGPNCTKTCNCRNSTEVCNKTTGLCATSGCREGWTERDCLTHCEDGTYGYNCSSTCGQCVDREVCNKTDGKCSAGCAPGFLEPSCHDCRDRYYGTECRRCGQCLNNSPCDKQTGLCAEGCQPGWKGDNCHEVCNGTYGYNCNETCGKCLGGVPCLKETGECPGGCHPDYEGLVCQALKASLFSSGLSWVVVVAVFAVVLGFLALGLFVYKRRNHREDKTPVVMSALRDDNDCSSDEQKPPRPSPYRTARTKGKKEDDDTYVNVESTVVKVQDLHQYIGKRVDKFESEYLRFRKGLQFPSKAAELEGNNGKNRFKAMYPYDHSRVVLIKLPKMKNSDYINASYIDGYKARGQYIASQGPNSNTIGDFWRMVWQEQSPIIVMLTRLTEGKREKCAQYWPEMGGSLVRGDLQVTSNSTLQKADFIIREFTVHNTKIDQRHHVTQLHFISWPDHGVPFAPALVRFWKLFRSLATSKTGPFIIHCSAGVGRTGTFIALDALVKQTRESNKLNVFEYVSKMRENRVSMVQTKEQYYFLHKVILEALRSESTHMTPSTFESHFKSDTLNSQAEEDLLLEEWKNIKELQTSHTDKEVAVSLLEENIKKSRMKEHFPPDALRPKLETPVPDTNDYINAVFIPSEYNGQGLVVTQLPLPWTVVDFWRLVLDHNVRTVVNLEPLQREKPDDEGTFWPETKTEMFSDPFIVSKVDTRARQITEVALQVWQKESAESTKHDVNLLFMDGWSESTDTPTNYSNFLQLITQVGMQESTSPVVVMCRNGSTRCGLFCAVLNIIQRLKSDSEIDIYLLIRQLQTSRPGFIPSYEQYKFCYLMVKEYQKSVNAVYENFQPS